MQHCNSPPVDWWPRSSIVSKLLCILVGMALNVAPPLGLELELAWLLAWPGRAGSHRLLPRGEGSGREGGAVPLTLLYMYVAGMARGYAGPRLR